MDAQCDGADAVSLYRREDDAPVAGRCGAVKDRGAQHVAAADGRREGGAAQSADRRVEDAYAVGVVRREDDAPVAGRRGAAER